MQSFDILSLPPKFGETIDEYVKENELGTDFINHDEINEL